MIRHIHRPATTPTPSTALITRPSKIDCRRERETEMGNLIVWSAVDHFRRTTLSKYRVHHAAVKD